MVAPYIYAICGMPVSSSSRGVHYLVLSSIVCAWCASVCMYGYSVYVSAVHVARLSYKSSSQPFAMIIIHIHIGSYVR